MFDVDKVYYDHMTALIHLVRALNLFNEIGLLSRTPRNMGDRVVMCQDQVNWLTIETINCRLAVANFLISYSINDFLL